MTISDTQLRALHNLADKQAGGEVDWISIADARALTELGLAERTPSGWVITSEGLSLIHDQPARAGLKLVPEPSRPFPDLKPVN
jgi:hypothetical protein